MEAKRIIQEKKTIEKMIKIYCKSHSNSRNLCDNCTAILEYIQNRIEHCKFGDCKPICSKCSIYCYNKEMKENIKQVMRYSGKRMVFCHPILTAAHFRDAIRSTKYQSL